MRAIWQPCFAIVLLTGWATFTSGPLPAYAQRVSPVPTRQDVSYGSHERNVLDYWQADSKPPTPVLVFIHGGGFVNGDKSGVRRRGVVEKSLAAGVSFASINYRFCEHAPIQDILRDAARAIQFLRHQAREWNIDPERIASFGSSAGAGTSLWLAFHDDLADPDADDPVLRQSSRLVAAGSLDGQASYDFRDWEKVLGPSPYQRPQSEILAFYGFHSDEEFNSPAGDRVMKDCSMLELISPDDPPVTVSCSRPQGESVDRGHYVHHPQHAIAIAERCRQQGVECAIFLRQDPHEVRDEWSAQVVDFLLAKLKQESAR
jgi:acetyl esterase/lipase